MKPLWKTLFCIAWAVVLMWSWGFQGAFCQAEEPSRSASDLAGCPLFPADNVWNVRVDDLPVAPQSDSYVQAIGADEYVHADFGSGTWEGSPIGIPFVEVSGTQPRVSVSFEYADESDPGPYPIPPDAPVEGGPDSDGDRHVLVLDRDACILYELFYAFPEADGSWSAGSGAVFDLRSNDLRPAEWTSADAAGLPILPGLARFDEADSGEIRHALRFTAPQTREAYVWPARHHASDLAALRYPPMGQRFRLKADFDVSGFSPRVRVILEALKRYGMMLADNGSPWFITGAPDERWDNDALRELHQVRGSDFEAVDVSSLMVHADSGRTKTSCLQVESDEPSTTVSFRKGQCVRLTCKAEPGRKIWVLLQAPRVYPGTEFARPSDEHCRRTGRYVAPFIGNVEELYYAENFSGSRIDFGENDFTGLGEIVVSVKKGASAQELEAIQVVTLLEEE